MVYEMARTIATWMAPILCFTAQDVADELGRATGEPFDVHGTVREDVLPAGAGAGPRHDGGQPNRRWTDEIRPRREAIMRPLEAFRAAGHKSLEARVTVRPSAAERPQWQFNVELLTELAVVSKIVLTSDDAPAATEIAVDEAAEPTCPRCWRRTGEAAGSAAPDPNLCLRCAAVVAEQAAVAPQSKGASS